MKTLNQHNQIRNEWYETMRKMGEPNANDIACPKCKNVLWDSEPGVLLTSDPPKLRVHCQNCGWRGFRFA